MKIISPKNSHNKPNKTKREEEDEYLFHDGVMHFMERKNQNKMRTCLKRKKLFVWVLKMPMYP
jgi:hypothetical protein